MIVRTASVGLLLIAVLAAAGCQTRLPLDPATDVAVSGKDAPVAALDTVRSDARFEAGSANRETQSTDPLRPFLADVETDRLQDMVRMDRFSDQRRGFFDCLNASVCVCVPSQHR